MSEAFSELSHRKRIGDFLIERGLIRQDSVEEILKLCEEKKIRFGEAALELGLITPDQLEEALAYPYKKEVFIRLNPAFFPKNTKDLISLQEALHLGVLPLGQKKKRSWFRTKTVLNLVHVGREPSAEALSWVKRHPQHEVQFFHALPNEFLRVLEVHYGFSEREALRSGDPIHGALRKILELHASI